LRQLLDIHVSTVEKNDIKSLEIRFLKPWSAKDLYKKPPSPLHHCT